ncbi:RNA polymerase sigma factor [Rhodohalobacter sp. 614A]|uniref:RNA polymerase sigma factor n=1 Tax=Rhodohalobacter sp. 614A TaxID=2908649 RepID=UPI001F20576D|nr:RNA polymerase sigma-70 factor [Rhodohalobacter sp. 614A]
MYDLNDTDLAIKIRAGNKKAFREIYDRYHVQMYYIAKKYVKSPDLAEDAVQDVFVKLWEKRARIDDSKSIKGFLFIMLRNHVLNMIRDKKDEIISISDIKSNQLPQQNLTEDELVYKEYHDIVKEGLKELSDRKREVFELRTLKGHSNSEVADLLNINIRTVKTHFYNSSKFMREYLKNHAGLLGLLIFFGLMALL